MKVHTDTSVLPSFRNAIATIGTFDGVHLGHRQIIRQLKEEASRIGGETVIITFHPHPRLVVGGKPTVLYLLSTLREKIALLEAQGIDHLVVVPFTGEFAACTAEAYVEDFLIKKFHPHTLIIGYDHKFGKGRKGDFHLLEDYAAKGAFRLIEIPGHLLNESAISSTRIRQTLLEGNVEEATALLGYSYFFSGIVTEGNKLGRTIGYPTANIAINDDEKLTPGNGVYAVNISVKGILYRGMMNIGMRPTVGGTNRVIEVNIFDFSEEIYGELVTVTLKKRLRAEQKFSGLDALKEQLAKDKTDAGE